MICSTRIWRTLVLLLAIMPSLILAQSKKDSLLNVLKKSGFNDTLCNELIWTYVFNQPDSAIYFGKRGLEWADKNGESRLKSKMLNRIGVAYDIKSKQDSALFFYNSAIVEAQKSGDRKSEGGALNNIGLVYWNQGKAEKAIEHYIRSAEIFEEIGNDQGLGNTYNNIALILFEDKQSEKALEYYRKALTVRKQIDHKYGIAATYTNLSQLYTYYGLKNLDSAMYYALLSIPLKLELDDQFGLARAYHNVAEISLERNRIDSAKLFFQKALTLQKKLDNSEGYASTYYNLASVYLKTDDYHTQLAYLDSSQKVAEKYNDLKLLWKVYSEKARSLGRIGKHAEARPYWLAYTDIKDSLQSIERSKQVEELETRYRTAEQEKEIAEKKANLADAELKLENRNKWIFGLLGGLLSLLLLGFALFQLSRRKAQAEKDAAIIAERERGLKAIIEATEEERKRIAKDLHDGIVQSLTGLSLRLQKSVSALSSLPERDKTHFNKSQEMLDDSISELRTISHHMMPRVLSEMGLIPALDDMLSKSLGNTDIEFEFEHHKVEGERFAENVEVSLYRITQELVNNIIKHSEAKAVSVQLLKTRTHLVLVVEDNGKGFNFDDKTNRNGIGLMNISSRAKAINGEVNYEPSPDQGTVATIRIPLQ